MLARCVPNNQIHMLARIILGRNHNPTLFNIRALGIFFSGCLIVKGVRLNS